MICIHSGGSFTKLVLLSPSNSAALLSKVELIGGRRTIHSQRHQHVDCRVTKLAIHEMPRVGWKPFTSLKSIIGCIMEVKKLPHKIPRTPSVSQVVFGSSAAAIGGEVVTMMVNDR